MKKRFLFLLLIPFFAVFLSGTSAYSDPLILLDLSDTYITEGEFFSVDVTMTEPFDPLADPFFFDVFVGFGFDVVNLNNVSYLGYTLGPDYNPAPAPFGDDLSGLVDVSAATPFNRLNSFPSDPDDWNTFNGFNITLATLEFQAGTAGSGSLGIYGDYPDPPLGPGVYEGLVYWDAFLNHYGFDIDESIDFEINVQPIPEPATMFLLGTGLIGLVGFGKKKLKK